MIRSEKIILNRTEEIDNWINEATSIYNQVLYYFRHEYFQAQKENRKQNYNFDIYGIIKESEVWKNSTLDYNAKQYVIRKVKDNWNSFYKSCIAYWKNKNKFTSKPNIPKYLKYGRTPVLIFDKTRLKSKNKENNTLCLPKSKSIIKIPSYINLDKIKCITLKSFYGKIKLFISYEKERKEIEKLNKDNYLGIDLGVNNIVSITTNNQNKSWIVKGGQVKSINQFYNKKLAKMKSTLEKINNQKTSKRIRRLNMKRNNKLDYEFHCLSKKIIQLCLDNNIGNIVIGQNKNWKQNSNLGKKNNQKFVQIPFKQLIQKIQYKSDEVGINVETTEESYTSKIDNLANEDMKKQENYLGKRIKRGLFKSSIGKILNADINGAIGILRKLNVFSDVDLFNLRNRGDVVSPLVLRY